MTITKKSLLLCVIFGSLFFNIAWTQVNNPGNSVLQEKIEQ